MKRIFIAITAVAALMLGASSCAKPDADFVHDNATISAIYICTTQKDASGKEKPDKFSGVIDQDAGTIVFTIPKASRKDIDLTVTAKMTGRTKDYHLTAKIEK